MQTPETNATVHAPAAPGVRRMRIPRHACTPRDTARAGDLWRIVQDAAVDDAADRGWPPERFRAMGTGFVVREMRAIHLREARYGEDLAVSTQIADHRRAVLMRRDTQIAGVMNATADWVHIGPDGAPGGGSPELIAAFPIHPDAGSGPALPEFPPTGSALGTAAMPSFTFSPWWTEMDPLGHTNHPRYVDWADEVLARALHAAGLDPVGVVPVADRVRFRLGARASDTVTITGDVRTVMLPCGQPGLLCTLRARRPRLDATELVADLEIVRGHLDPTVPATLLRALHG